MAELDIDVGHSHRRAGHLKSLQGVPEERDSISSQPIRKMAFFIVGFTEERQTHVYSKTLLSSYCTSAVDILDLF